MREIVRARLQAQIAGVGVDWNASAQGIYPPRLVLTLVSGSAQVVHDGPSGWRSGRVQVDCYGATYAAAVVLADQVRGALNGWTDGAQGIAGVFLIGETDLPPDTEGADTLARVILDFTINWNEG